MQFFFCPTDKRFTKPEAEIEPNVQSKVGFKHSTVISLTTSEVSMLSQVKITDLKLSISEATLENSDQARLQVA